MKTELIKMEPQPPKSATYHKVYCDPYSGQDDKWTFWDRDGRMCLYDGNIPNTAHWKPPMPKPLAVVQVESVWYWLYKEVKK